MFRNFLTNHDDILKFYLMNTLPKINKTICEIVSRVHKSEEVFDNTDMKQ